MCWSLVVSLGTVVYRTVVCRPLPLSRLWSFETSLARPPSSASRPGHVLLIYCLLLHNCMPLLLPAASTSLLPAWPSIRIHTRLRLTLCAEPLRLHAFPLRLPSPLLVWPGNAIQCLMPTEHFSHTPPVHNTPPAFQHCHLHNTPQPNTLSLAAQTPRATTRDAFRCSLPSVTTLACRLRSSSHLHFTCAPNAPAYTALEGHLSLQRSLTRTLSHTHLTFATGKQ
jgi:hypothetical protein